MELRKTYQSCSVTQPFNISNPHYACRNAKVVASSNWVTKSHLEHMNAITVMNTTVDIGGLDSSDSN